MPKLCPVKTEIVADNALVAKTSPPPNSTAPLAGVVRIACGDSWMETIQAVRKVVGPGLKEAISLVKNAPSIIKEGVPQSEAEAIKAVLESVGATAVVWPQRRALQYAEAGHRA
jgi:ribosomal protein L7/L12